MLTMLDKHTNIFSGYTLAETIIWCNNNNNNIIWQDILNLKGPMELKKKVFRC